MSIPEIKSSANDADKERILSTLTLAFAQDPLMRWFFPDGHRYLSDFPRFLEAFGGNAFPNDQAYFVGDHDGAALWLPPGVHVDEEKAIETMTTTVDQAVLEQAAGLLEKLDDYHPHDEPCWYLAVLGIDINKQGRGLGALLMKDVLARCDETGTLAYLESSNPRNVSFYQRHGFEIMDELSLGNPEPLTPMIRHPR